MRKRKQKAVEQVPRGCPHQCYDADVRGYAADTKGAAATKAGKAPSFRSPAQRGGTRGAGAREVWARQSLWAHFRFGHSLIRKQVLGVAISQENKLQIHKSSLSEMNTLARTHGKTRAVPLRSSISAAASPGALREVRGRQVSSCLSPLTFTYPHQPPQQPLPSFLRRPPRPWATVALADASVALGPEPRTTSRDSESCLQSKRHGQTIGGRTWLCGATRRTVQYALGLRPRADGVYVDAHECAAVVFCPSNDDQSPLAPPSPCPSPPSSHRATAGTAPPTFGRGLAASPLGQPGVPQVSVPAALPREPRRTTPSSDSVAASTRMAPAVDGLPPPGLALLLGTGRWGRGVGARPPFPVGPDLPVSKSMSGALRPSPFALPWSAAPFQRSGIVSGIGSGRPRVTYQSARFLGRTEWRASL